MQNGGHKRMAEDIADVPVPAENPGMITEFLEFLRENRKWWLAPLLLALLGIGGLLVLAGNNAAIAPFIYTLF